jgi:hypothetical protein
MLFWYVLTLHLFSQDDMRTFSIYNSDLFGVYKYFVLIVCKICLGCIHICSDGSYDLFGTQNFFGSL